MLLLAMLHISPTRGVGEGDGRKPTTLDAGGNAALPPPAALPGGTNATETPTRGVDALDEVPGLVIAYDLFGLFTMEDDEGARSTMHGNAIAERDGGALSSSAHRARYIDLKAHDPAAQDTTRTMESRNPAQTACIPSEQSNAAAQGNGNPAD